MTENIQLLLLKIIKFNGDLTPLIKLGYEYSQIASLIQREIETLNAKYENGTLLLTEKGNNVISELIKTRKSGSQTWIEPEISSKIPSINKDFIYLPSRKELSF